MNTSTHHAGMDIHASNTVIQPIDPKGEQIQQREVPTQANKLISWARSYPYGQLQVILEQGIHARWVASALTPRVDRLVICDPAENALVHQSGLKNDQTDAHKLARLLGINLPTTNMVNVALNDNAEVVLRAKLPTGTRSLEDFFGDLEAPVQAVVECTSNWYWLSDWCRDNGIDLMLAHAKMIKAISYAKVKTDKVDAKTLAELLKADLIPEAYRLNMIGGSYVN